MNYPSWLYGPLGSLLGVAMGVIVVVVLFEIIWRRETGKRWWWLGRNR